MAIDLLIKFEIFHDGNHWCARGVEVDIFTQGNTLDELNENLKEAVEIHYDEELRSGEDIKVVSISKFEVRSFAKATGG